MDAAIKIRHCHRCKQTLDISCFHKNRARNDGFQTECKECFRTRYSAAQRRLWNIKKTYGLDWASYLKMMSDHGNKCQICKRTVTPAGDVKSTTAHIDHDHVTGKVRGILCYSCNLGIGHLKNDPKILFSAIEYLCPNEVEDEISEWEIEG